ncbi:MAG TPA: glycosyltransferase family 2 protein [Micropruina sp.]|nr:glycosyltransferase family 2 protein [Micropruina sp.]
MKLSVIIPCYNVAEQLPTLVRSLQGNLRRDFEFVLVEDCSADDTPSVLAELIPTVPGARLVQHDRNRGISAARNSGLAVAQGTYLVWLDSDDWIGPGYLDQLVRVIERLGCDFVRTDHVRVLGRRRTIVRSPESRRNLVLPPRTGIAPPFRSTSVDYPNVWAGIQHRRLATQGLLTFDEDLRTCEDRHWIWRMHRDAQSFATVGLLGLFYRQGLTQSLSHISSPDQLHFLDAMQKVVDETLADPTGEPLLLKAVDAYCALINFHLTKRGRLTPALQRELIRRSILALDGLPQDLLDQALKEGAPRRRTLLTRMRRNPQYLKEVA